MTADLPFHFACPVCHAPLVESINGDLSCPVEGTGYNQVEGIWRFLPPGIEAKYSRFVREYETVRRLEGRGSPDPAYYRSLPARDLTGHFERDWKIRYRSYQSLVEKVIRPLEKLFPGCLSILDLGAGNGWLSYQLAKRGHSVAAVDLSTNPSDGLGTWSFYDKPYIPIQADFDRLPFLESQFHLAVYNASFHYSTGYESSLRETLRLLIGGGQVVIMDSPLYRQEDSGRQMVRERQVQFQRDYGFPSNALPSENFLTYDRLADLAKGLSIRWDLVRPAYGLAWSLRPWKALALQQREPAQFGLIVGSRLVQ
jgi:SAM-dependent methyltransferase